MMEKEDVLPEATGSTKRREMKFPEGGENGRGKTISGQRNKDIRPQYPGRIQNPEGFDSDDWDEVQQEEDKWQAPDKWQRISQMVFCNRVQRIHPVGDEAISSLGAQHQGG